MVGCSAYKCKSRSERKEQGLSFHSFPRDLEKRNRWVENMKIKDWTPSLNDRICSKHFEKKWFYKGETGVYVRLLHQAVPTIFPELPKYLQPKQPSKRPYPRSNRKPGPSTSIPTPESPKTKLAKKQLSREVSKSKQKTRKRKVMSPKQKSTLKMTTEKQSCCFCFNITSKGNVMDSDMLDLLKFLIINLDTHAFENSDCVVCDSCINKITETCEYKTRNSSRMLVETKEEIDCEKTITCQKCKKLYEQGDTVPLMDCITQIDWSDFVNYLFVNPDSQSLENMQICYSCRISLSDIQDILKLIYVYDQNKMKCDIDNYCNDITPTGNESLVEDTVEIKQEFEDFITDAKIKIENVIDDIKTKIDDSDISYADFKCKNEEIELKLERDDGDDDQLTDRCENVDVDKEMKSGVPTKNNFSNQEEVQGVNSQDTNTL